MSLHLVPTWAQRLPSMVIETGGGFAVALLVAWCPWWWLRAPLGVALSLYYERYQDPNGFNWNDVLERLPAMLAGELMTQRWLWHP